MVIVEAPSEKPGAGFSIDELGAVLAGLDQTQVDTVAAPDLSRQFGHAYGHLQKEPDACTKVQRDSGFHPSWRLSV
jgi:hypothetical protein